MFSFPKIAWRYVRFEADYEWICRDIDEYSYALCQCVVQRFTGTENAMTDTNRVPSECKHIKLFLHLPAQACWSDERSWTCNRIPKGAETFIIIILLSASNSRNFFIIHPIRIMRICNEIWYQGIVNWLLHKILSTFPFSSSMVWLLGDHDRYFIVYKAIYIHCCFIIW